MSGLLRRAVVVATGLAVAAIALGGCGGASEQRSAPSGGAWRLPNADLRNTRNVGGPIDASSVGRLERVWATPVAGSTDSPIGGIATTPIVDGRVVYVQDLDSNVTALDLASGRQLWRRAYDEPDTGPNGVTVAGDRIFGATASRAFALDARSGAELWSRKLVANAHEGIDMAPGYHEGTVYVSTVPANARLLYGAGGRGVLWALDAATGRPRWSWDQVPADLWGHPETNAGGGMWHPPAFDERGGLYIAIANPAPFPGTPGAPWGASRPGPNRWTNSIVKLDARSGRFVWGRQVVPHDLYDWDLECPVMLVRSGGRLLAVTGGKMGLALAFDAETGREVWRRAVGQHNGHDRDNLRAMRGETAAFEPQPEVLPGQFGGIETPMATDGERVYVPVVNRSSTYGNEGLPVPAERGTGELVALDVASGRVQWQRPLPADDYGGATVVNDVVLTTTLDGTVWAMRTDSGEVAWRTRLPAGSNAPVAVAGDMLLAAAGVVRAKGERPTLIAYRLASE